MSLYKLNTGLWTTKEEEFDSDSEAWETLRKSLPDKWAGLYKLQTTGKIVNHKSAKKRFDAKYRLQKIEDNIKTWVVVLFGSTNDNIDDNKNKP